MSQPGVTVFADYTRWLRAAAAGLLWALALALPGCWVIPPKVLTTPNNPVPVAKHFPSALLAEPIQLREGYTHVTQPFTIKAPNERWSTSLGFVAANGALTVQKRLVGGSDMCWTNGPDEAMRPRTCKNKTPGFHLRWELLREDGVVVVQRERDNLAKRGGGTYSANAITRTLSGFSNQRPGAYRLRITVLRDAKELDYLRPHILIDRPFFSFDGN
ncbi:hypothetical protein [Variovorax sp. RA8]|uniref:hypothetical protein n=1 Tax=Variovorax sp. (strain JCM 16519 / RA8) TaxID=662548 RepID=UPI000AFDA69D|nr:hypothetical protein [Variovorax sp. RA8]VTU26279.1 hypothetical protein RA8CHR_03309 [Variovorax sp. RA8]